MPAKNDIFFRRGSSSNWSSINPILNSGEPGFDVTLKKLKIGDGVTPWNSLEWLSVISVSGEAIFPQSIHDVSGIFFDTSFGPVDQVEGQLNWNNETGTIDVGLTSDLTMHVGQDIFFRVKNSTGSPITKGEAVAATGVIGGGEVVQIAPFAVDGSIDEVRFIGLVADDIPNGGDGYVVNFGHVKNVDLRTSNSTLNPNGETWNVGDILFVDDSSAGGLTKVQPKDDIYVAMVLDDGQNGELLVRITDPGHISDLHDVNTNGVTNQQYLTYQSSTDTWIPTSSGIFTSGIIQQAIIGDIEIIDNTISSLSGDLLLYPECSGYVGINVDEPNSMLHVYSSVSGDNLFNVEGTYGSLFFVDDNLSGSIFSVNNIAGFPIFEVFSDDSVVAGRYGENDFVISSGGNVGIGTNAPNATLHVYSATSGDNVFNVEGTNGSLFGVTDNLSGVLMSVNTIAGLPVLEVNSDYSITAGRFNQNDFVISSGGNIGIGTSSPSGKLDIQGNAYFGIPATNNSIYLRSGLGSVPDDGLKIRTDQYGNMYFDSNSSYVKVGNQDARVELVAGAGYIDIRNSYNSTTSSQYVRFAPANTERMRLTHEGKLGIGTSAPQTLLDVSGVITATGGNSNEWNEAYDWINSSGVDGSGAANHIAYWSDSNSITYDASQLYWDSSNNRLGVGTSSPSYNIHTTGNALLGNISLSNNTISPNVAWGGNLTISQNNGDGSIILQGTNSGSSPGGIKLYPGKANAVYIYDSGNIHTYSLMGDGIYGKQGLWNGGVFTLSSADGTTNVYAGHLRIKGGDGGPSATYASNGGNVYIQAGNKNPTGPGYDGEIYIRDPSGVNMHIFKSDGFIGFGTTSPQQKLHIDNGNVRVENTTPVIEFHDTSAVGADISFVNDGLVLSHTDVTGDNQLVIASNSGVGIGTNAPTATLHAYSPVPSSTVFNVEGTNGSLFSVVDNLSGVLMSVNNNAGLPVFEVYDDDSIIAGRFAQNDFVISSGGSVGIGTDSPVSKLDVSGVITANGGDSDEWNQAYDWVSASGGLPFASGTGSAGHVAFWTDTNQLSYDNGQLYWDSTNNRLGIGTSSPSNYLTIGGTLNSKLKLTGGTAQNSMRFDAVAGGDAFDLLSDTNGFNVIEGANVRFTVGNNGNIGINNSSPAYTLDVAGTANITGNVIVGGNVTVNGTTVSANVDTMEVADPILTLGLSSGNIVTNTNLDRGMALALNDGVMGFMGWDTSENEFSLLSSGVASNGSGNYAPGTYGDLHVGNLEASGGYFSGNVGIGDSSPSSKLHVVGAVLNNSFQDYGIAAFENTDLEGLSIGYDADGGYTYLLSREVGVSTRGLHLNGSIYVNSYGNNVGVGTTSPSYKLDVNGTAGFSSTINAPNIGTGEDDSVVILDSDGKLRTDEIDSRVWGSTLADMDDIAYVSGLAVGASGVNGTGSSGQVAFWTGTNDISGDSSLFWDNANDRLGINTASPQHQLHIKASSYEATAAIESFSNQPTTLYFIQQTVAGTGYIQHSNWSGGMTFKVGYDWVNGGFRWRNNANSQLMRLTTDGNLGININEPSGTLHVVGEAYVDNLKLDGNTLSATNTDGNLILSPNGNGALQRASIGNTRGIGAVDLQVNTAGNDRVASGQYSVAGGGCFNKAGGCFTTVGGGCGNIASLEYSTIAGGKANTTSGSYSTIGGGWLNTANGLCSTIGGGRGNSASGHRSIVGGGQSNSASNNYSIVSGGFYNCASGNSSSVGGGYVNNASGCYSKIGGGRENCAACSYSAVVGGLLNVASGDYSAVVAGSGNTNLGAWSFIGGGINHLNNSSYSTIGGGCNQYINASYAVVAGGRRNCVNGSYGTVSGGYANSAYCQGSAVAGGVVNRACACCSFVGGGYYSCTFGANSAIVGGFGNCTASGGCFGFIGAGNNNNVYCCYGFIGGGLLNVASGDYSAVVAGSGNIANGACSFIGGGRNNTTTFSFSVIAGGYNNSSTCYGAVVAGGCSNTSSGFYSFVGGGKEVVASGNYSSVAGGFGNQVHSAATYGTMSGGYRNCVYGGLSAINGGLFNKTCAVYSIIGAGGYNEIQASGTWGFIGGGCCNLVTGDNSCYGVIGGGFRNISYGTASVIGGGSYNCASNTQSFVGGGYSNNASENYATIGGGYNNTASGKYATVGGGYENVAIALRSTVSGGVCNGARATYAIVGGGYNNNACGCASTIGGGQFNTANWCSSTISGGSTNNVYCCYGFIGGGTLNVASGDYSAVVAGSGNIASGACSFIGGGQNNVSSNNRTTVGGGSSNTASASFATVAGGIANFALGDSSSIGGGKLNCATSSCSTVSGGYLNCAQGSHSTVSGGALHNATGGSSAIGGGYDNCAGGGMSVVAGGRVNCVTGECASILGGYCNISSGNFSSIAGGKQNFVNARHGSINGGHYNIIQSPTNECCSRGATISGGIGHNTSGGTADGTTGDITGAVTCCNAGCFSTISGGCRNIATGPYSSVSGGWNNTASGNYSTVSGGYGNCATVTYSTVGGGGSNTASGEVSTVGGGYYNRACGNCSTVSGGFNNSASETNSIVSGGYGNNACGYASIVSGGYFNCANGDYSTIGGGNSNIASGFNSTVSGGKTNCACATNSSVSGGCKNFVNARHGSINGGHFNVIQSPTNECCSRGATIGGGIGHNTSGGTIDATTGDITGTITCCNAGTFSTIGGGVRNCVTGTTSTVSGGTQNYIQSGWSFIGGGNSNVACGNYSTIGGGRQNTTSGYCSTISGGYCNVACAVESTISGGVFNRTHGNTSTIGGGRSNCACGNCSTVSGGYSNLASNVYSTVGGGYDNTANGAFSFVGGGRTNVASGACSTVGGGCSNTASGTYSTIAGGKSNTLSGTHSFTAGYSNNDGGYANVHILGSGITATQADTTYTQNIIADGHLAATTKSFLINHPTRPGHKLQYGSLESPYHGVRLTGRDKITSGWCVVKLPEYIRELVHDNEDVNIQLTNYNHSKTLYVSEVNVAHNEFTVKTDSWFANDLEFYWSFTATRKDIDPLRVEY